VPTFGSLFAGIGGIDLGLERAGWECRWQVEIDSYCQAVLHKHWPDVPKFGDVKELGEGDLGSVELIAGGFPCQPVSQAGSRRAQADERWLWPQMERIVRLLRPGFVLVENVSGLLHRGMGDVLGGLAALGYDAEWDCVPAAAVGAPHLRDRAFIVAYPHGERSVHGQAQGQPAAAGESAQRDAGAGSSVGALRRSARELAPVAHPNGKGRSTGRERDGEPLGIFTNPPQRYDADGRPRWVPEPDVGRVVDGLPSGLDRARVAALGNAVVPQVAEWIGRRLLEVSSGNGGLAAHDG
jgi:DNA (cytosine-5)-methyltransferase 1